MPNSHQNGTPAYKKIQATILKRIESGHLKAGDAGAPLNLGQNWFVYRVAEKVEPNPADFETQKKQLMEAVLQSKRDMAYKAFQLALNDRLKQEGKLKIMPEKLKSFGTFG